jgi:hypothetical protein
LRRATDSVRAQTFGQFRIVFVKYKELDISNLIKEMQEAGIECQELSVPGGNRARTLYEGLRHISSPYFAVLDDDDFWLSDHFETLFRAGRAVKADFDVAFSGSIGFDYPIYYRKDQFCDRNILRFGFDREPRDGLGVQAAIGTNCFVARSDLLSESMLDVPEMETAEDSLLIALVSRRSKPIFSYKATAFHRRDAPDGSQWQTHPRRVEDEISLSLRAGLAWSPQWLSHPTFEVPQKMWVHQSSKQARRATQAPESAKENLFEHEKGDPRVRELEALVAAFQASTSWRITAPLRSIARFIRRERA